MQITKKMLVWATLGVVTFLFFTVMLFVTKRVNVDAGTEAVVVDHPFWTFISNGGVRPEPMQTGSQWVFYTTDLIVYDLRPVQKTEHFEGREGTITSNNIPITFNAYIKVRPIEGKTPKLHATKGPQWYEQNLKEMFRTAVRDEVAKHHMTELTARQEEKSGAKQDDKSKGNVIPAIQQKLLAQMRAFVTEKSMDVEVMEIIVGKATPPDQILAQLAETGAQEQRVETEGKREAAEVSRKNAEIARANADNAYRNNIGLNQEQFVALELANRQIKAAEACGKQANCTVIVGQIGSGATLPLGHK